MTDAKHGTFKNACVELKEEDLDQAGAAPALRGASSPQTKPAIPRTRGWVRFEIDLSDP